MPFEPKHPVPVFPLPGVVLFPCVHLPVHVFELRYRTMVREALSGERVIALALLCPGWERDYHGSPEFHPLGCLARIDEVSWLPDDCYDLRLLGLSRVRLGRMIREFPFRAVRAEVLPQAPFSEDDTLVQLERRALIEVATRFTSMAAGPGPMAEGGESPARGSASRSSAAEVPAVPLPPADVGRSLAFEPLVNTLCMALAVAPEEKLPLLELDSVLERSRRVRELMEEHVLRAGRGGARGGERN